MVLETVKDQAGFCYDTEKRDVWIKLPSKGFFSWSTDWGQKSKQWRDR
jgi:hypothetical protein